MTRVVERLNHLKNKIKVYMWIVSFIGNYRNSFFALILTGFIISSIMLIIPKFVQYIIDVIIPNNEIKQLISLLLILVPLIFLMLIAMLVRNYVQREVQEKSASDLQVRILEQLRKLGIAHYDNNPSGNLLSLFQAEIPTIQNIYRRYLPQLVEKSIMLLVSLFFLISINAILTLIIIPFFLSYYLVGPHFEKKQAQYAKDASQARTAFNKKIYDSLSGLLELKIHGAEKWDIDQLLQKYEVNRSLWMKEIFFALLRGTTRRISINIGAVFLFLYGVILIQNGNLQVGEFVAFLMYYFYVMGDLTRLITLITEQGIMVTQGMKLYDLVKKEPTVSESMNPQKIDEIRGELTVKNISFSYSEEQSILNGVTLHIKPGQKVAIVGPSGGGKSTLLKMIGRFYDPTHGQILLDDVPIKDLSFKQLRDSIGYVFQETYLFGGSIKENIRFGNPEASDLEVVRAAKAANAHDFISNFVYGYETIVGERGVKLSGGQKQRIAIARMIIKCPNIVLLDEATAALDQISETKVQDSFDRLLQGKTIITVAHRLSTIKNYDLIVVLEQGTVSEIGNYQELIEKKGSFYRLLYGGEEVHV